MNTIQELLNNKGSEIFSVQINAPVIEALHLLAEKRIGALIVMDGEMLAGILSERDYARKVVLEGKTSSNTKVREIMTSHVVCARPDQKIEECLAIMSEKRVRHLPILDAKQLVGMVSIGDLVKAIIAEQKFQIEQMEHYISG
ncbi:Inosine-5'-monophosphate dehydrogenase [hydrothermal vent metagenome]|uniref:Inosine-5'-monophosphate dehydrogenase n=1 Tax=hydrothermal vent metagenome TaxID=652676 RepID=A0A3B1B7I4_9ZZZZ